MKDGHIHSPYCPHGSKDDFEKYIQRAIDVGLTEMTFTEHFPYPNGFQDPAPENDSCMNPENLSNYLDDVKNFKQKYESKIKINVGAEVDFLEGYEEDIKNNLDKYGDELEDSLLSVHIIKIDGAYCCVDYSVEEFQNLIDKLGSIEAVYNKYYETLIKAVNADLGTYKPKRIGHLNLVRKFNQVFPYNYEGNKVLEELIKLVKEKGYELDYNVSGNRKEYCKEPYVDVYLLELAKKYDIPLVLGSDSHCAEEINNYDIG
ncbi:histidinol-phosphatase HisJ [Clostridioides sp. ES-S-0010-02]|uniref:histidinol-phosphatase HisJ n=1 Tax=Clostridioides sp. ES-S-0010-02 TaxID=2770776 RepID=UPI001D0F8521|nr:histidinol-phosphatase HisJ [Clostridioides sp. ES-S-0010-02]